MNIQIFGIAKCFDTKKAERYFKERRIKFQSVDLKKYGISRGELLSVINAVGLENIIDEKKPDSCIISHLAYKEDKIDKLFDNQQWIKTPIVRNGKSATVGYCPEIWDEWK